MATDRRSKLRQRSVKRKAVNIGFAIFVFLFLYIIVSFLLSLRKPQPSIYEVQKISLATNNLARAVVVRQEQNVLTEASGYVNFYLKNGTRVAKNEAVFSVDDSRSLHDTQKEKLEYTMSEEDIREIKDSIANHARTYQSGDSSNLQDLKTDLQTHIVNIIDMYRLENLSKISEGSGSGALQLCKAPDAGIVSFFTDSLDGLTADAVDASTFDDSKYSSSTLFSSELREAGSTAYKLVTNETWSLVLNLSEEQFLALSDSTELSFTITDDNLSLTAKASIYRKGDSYFARINLNKYLIRYINKRFLIVSIDMRQSEGLKIPRKAIIEKYFYVVPKQYIVYTQGKTGITIYELDENNEPTYRFYETEVYYFDDEYAYIDDSVIQKHGQFIIIPHTMNQYQVSTQKKLEGVYCINKGYAQFRMISRLFEGEDYIIVKSGVDRSISVYDFIWADAETLSEDQLITH
ncbi:MAG: hypothetical protein J5649_05410 [Lachnospiraceae bacterium]|nr:hypothetical protein [Lachnospiraceae bacterium]